MTQGVTVTLSLKLKEEAADGFCAGMSGSIKETQKRPGFRAIRIIRHKEDPTRVLLIEDWDAEQDYHDYIAWRTERGDMKGFPDIQAAPPVLDIWPTPVAAIVKS